MTKATSAYAKNIIRRSFQEIIEPSPTKEDKERIWQFFECKCAYCGRPLDRFKEEGQIDHLVPTSLLGLNHISNLVLSCGNCNEEKLDKSWHELLLNKYDDLDIVREHLNRIRKWQELNKYVPLDKGKIDNIMKLADSVVKYYDMKVGEAKKIIKAV